MTCYRDLVLEYGVDAARLPAHLRAVFVELDLDQSTRNWIDAGYSQPDSWLRTALRNAAARFVSFYDANGLANVGQDRVLGTAQWQRLLGRGGRRLLDVGAGEGAVTGELAALFDEIVTTEVSAPLARRLRARGYTCHECDIAFAPLAGEGHFDLVALQNVIDRTTHPLRLIDRATSLLVDDGRLVVAVPVPVRPVVFIDGARFTPAEVLPGESVDFESTVAALYAQVFVPRGLNVIALTRVPYLCRGDARAPVKRLDDAIFVLTRRASQKRVEARA
ncbi:MAG: methyltransferase domain-containing protein [Panacagrimonas sp.]